MAPIPTRTVAAFPKERIERILGQWWDEKINSTLAQRRSPEECRRLGGTVFDIQPELSSTQAVPVLLELSDLLGYEPDKEVIRSGGYQGRNDFIQGMCQRLEADHAEKQGISKPPSVLTAKGANVHAQL
ncbi:MAG: hypothetical protein ABSD53_18480 [Terriglobales bacterium]|jgi:hypothetical protein